MPSESKPKTEEEWANSILDAMRGEQGDPSESRLKFRQVLELAGISFTEVGEATRVLNDLELARSALASLMDAGFLGKNSHGGTYVARDGEYREPDPDTFVG